MHRRDVEIITLAHDEDEPSAGERPRTGYRFADMRASLLMGIGSIFWLTVFKVATFFVYQWVWPHWAPWTAYAAFSLSLIYQFCIHTELVDRLPRPIEYVFNTPSHHRVHHGSDPEYLDRNYGGILIVWDRMFGTFQPEVRRPTYGLTVPVETYNVLRLEYGAFVTILRQVRAARSWRER